MNTNARVKQLEALMACKNGAEIKVLIRGNNESDMDCISRFGLQDYPQNNILVFSETDVRL